MTTRKNGETPGKIQQALELLNEAARDKREELYEALNTEYQDLRSFVGGIQTSITHKAGQIKKKTQSALASGQRKVKRSVKSTAVKVDATVHEHPWLYLGGIAVSAFLIGYGVSRKNSAAEEGLPEESLRQAA